MTPTTMATNRALNTSLNPPLPLLLLPLEELEGFEEVPVGVAEGSG